MKNLSQYNFESWRQIYLHTIFKDGETIKKRIADGDLVVLSYKTLTLGYRLFFKVNILHLSIIINIENTYILRS